MHEKITRVLISIFCLFLIYSSDSYLYSQTLDRSPAVWQGFELLYPRPADTGIRCQLQRSAFDDTEPFATDDFEVAYKGSAMWGGYRDLVLRDRKAFCLSENGLVIMDVTIPTSPEVVSKTYLPGGYSSCVAVSGNFAYVGTSKSPGDVQAWRGDFHVLDISDVSNPKVVSVMEARTCLYSIAISGDWAYLGGAGEMLAVDISDKYAPEVTYRFLIPDTMGVIRRPFGLTIWQEHLFAADFDIRVYNISDPSKLELVADLITPKYAKKVGICDSILVIAEGDIMQPAQHSAILLADISNPEEPLLTLSYPLYGFGDAHGFTTDGPNAYIGGDQGVWMAEIIDTDQLSIIGYYPSPGFCMGLSVCDGLMSLVSFSIPFWNESLGDCSTCFCENPSDSIVYRGDCQFVDLSAPGGPCLSGRLAGGSYVDGVGTSGRYAYTISGWVDKSLGIVDVSSSDVLTEVGVVTLEAVAHDLCLSDDILYLLISPGDLEIYDLADPKSPTCIAALDLPGAVRGKIQDQVLYVAGEGGGLLLIDVSDPHNPDLISQFPSGYAVDVDLCGDTAYVAGYGQGLYIVDVSNIHHPSLVGHCAEISFVTGVEVNDGLACVQEGLSLVTVDVSNPANPRLMDRIGGGYFMRDVEVVWDEMQAVTANGSDGIVFIDVSDPYNLVLSGGYDSPGFVERVLVDGDYIYLAEMTGLVRLGLPLATDADELQSAEVLPSETAIHQPYPNPFNSETHIPVDISTKMEISVEIYNILGQKVRTVFDGTCVAGHHNFTWDGLDARSRVLPTGVYFVRLRTTFGTSGSKAVLLK